MTKKELSIKTHCGYIAISGRPNVGKSTLLNTILGEKISITSRKPQTTRHKILGIKTVANTQMIYVDMPGIYQAKNTSEKSALNRQMLKTAWTAIADVDLIIFVIDITARWQEGDEWILNKLKTTSRPIILAINKVDQIKSKCDILPFLDKIKTKADFVALLPISAKNKTNIEALEKNVADLLPENHFFFPEDQITDKNDRFLTAEIIREKLMRHLGDELPYSINVEIEKFEEQEKITKISAVIILAKESHKAIVIGAKGEKLKEIGTKARLELEKLFARKVFLQLWVKVKPEWTHNNRLLHEFGYDN